MKVRIKATGEIINIAKYAKVTLDKCDSYGDPIELSFDEVEVINQPTMEELEASHTIFIQPSDMPSEKRMRYEISKEAIPGACKVLSNLLNEPSEESIAYLSIKIADELIKQLKESEAPE